ncbi:hypothetical protein [Roseomonas chloroacetimidivorans]|uniref:hypothetical protein n=1 Tax=Roseomonas chloroacetimidivorans TaxID=1766656 RepID=UPI003C769BE5
MTRNNNSTGQRQGQRQNAPLLPACRLYRKNNSTTGAPFLIGRLGGLRVLILPNGEGEEGEHTHNLLIGEAAQRDSAEGQR